MFREHGGNTEYLERISSVLLGIHEGIAAMPAFVAALLEHELLESFVLDIQFDDGAQHRFAGFYTHPRRAAGASSTARRSASCMQPGYLQAIYMVIASLSQFPRADRRANKLNAADR